MAFIPKAKLSKKARREMDQAQRQMWQISPVTRKAPDKTKYDRKKLDRRYEHDDGRAVFYGGYAVRAVHGDRRFPIGIRSAKTTDGAPTAA